MNDITSLVRLHYQQDLGGAGDAIERIRAAVDAMGDGPLSAARLAGLDQFHVGGLAATVELAARTGITAETRVLDAGSGLGGPARYLASTFGCQVIGVDLAPYYVALAEYLTGRAGLTGQVSFQTGDLTRLPFPDGDFDLVWTQHVVMNIREREALYQEIRRVIRRGGRFVFYDAIAADGKPDPYYPVPWSETAATSTLLTEAETRAVLNAAGLRLLRFDDVTQLARGWVSQTPPPVPGASLSALIGPRIAEMVGNFIRNIGEGRVRLAMGICEAV